VLTSGGAQPWAICSACASSGGASLRSPWLTVLGWFVKPILLLVGVYIALRLLLASR
jgi:hypothetical protein